MTERTHRWDRDGLVLVIPEVRRYMSEDSDVMRSIQALEADHRQALIRAEEEGYNKGVQDMRRHGCAA